MIRCMARIILIRFLCRASINAILIKKIKIETARNRKNILSESKSSSTFGDKFSITNLYPINADTAPEESAIIDAAGAPPEGSIINEKNAINMININGKIIVSAYASPREYNRERR